MWVFISHLQKFSFPPFLLSIIFGAFFHSNHRGFFGGGFLHFVFVEEDHTHSYLRIRGESIGE